MSEQKQTGVQLAEWLEQAGPEELLEDIDNTEAIVEMLKVAIDDDFEV